jgi:hypothetical protein
MSLKSFFIKDEGESVLEKKVETKQPAKKPTNLGSNGSDLKAEVNKHSTLMSLNQSPNEFTDFLNNVYQQGNFLGPDYQEYTDALKESESLAVDEKTKFVMIFGGFKAMGLTKAKLLETGRAYVELIEAQRNGFNDTVARELQNEVGSRKNKIEDLENSNAEIEKQMIAMNALKNENALRIDQLSKEAVSITDQFSSKKMAFNSAADDFINKVDANLTKIQTYLPDATK